MERASRFYAEAFHAAIVATGETKRGRGTRHLFDGGVATTVRYAHLAFDGGAGVVLFEFDPSVAVPVAEQTRDRLMHFGIGVDDVPTSLARVEAAGGRRCFDPRDDGWGPYLFLKDPDGHVIELMEGPFERLLQRFFGRDEATTKPPLEKAVLHHIAIRVADNGAAVARYRAAFDATDHGVVPVPSELAELFFEGPRGTAVDVAVLGLPGGVGCELFTFSRPEKPLGQSVQSHDAVMHLGLEVDDLDAVGAAISRGGAGHSTPTSTERLDRSHSMRTPRGTQSSLRR